MRETRRTGRRTRPALVVAGILVVSTVEATGAYARTDPAMASEPSTGPGAAVPPGLFTDQDVASLLPDAPDAAPPDAAAMPSSGPDTCIRGMFWRKAIPGDHVCVTQNGFSLTRLQNAQAPEHTRPDGSCTPSNWVWRWAVPNDRTCVHPTAAQDARGNTARATSYWVATRDRITGNDIDKDPFWYPAAYYRIRSVQTSPWLYANVYGGSTADGTKVTLRGNTPGRQNFTFRRVGGGVAYQNTFEIVARHSGKCLDVQGFSKNDGAPVIQWPCHGGANQKWYFQRRADNFWEIRSVDSDKCLDAANPNNPAVNPPPSGAQLQQWTCLGNKNQAWMLASPN
ncbi:RICIN domain-containing protein [Streptomyces sp. NPDC053079]|uniref:RICIN domain-containing protein n=1 Tax=Streptomyces sp. NPDC053079 TaxID=3365697 RepID=UPI0037D3F46C